MLDRRNNNANPTIAHIAYCSTSTINPDCSPNCRIAPSAASSIICYRDGRLYKPTQKPRSLKTSTSRSWPHVARAIGISRHRSNRLTLCKTRKITRRISRHRQTSIPLSPPLLWLFVFGSMLRADPLPFLPLDATQSSLCDSLLKPRRLPAFGVIPLPVANKAGCTRDPNLSSTNRLDRAVNSAS